MNRTIDFTSNRSIKGKNTIILTQASRFNIDMGTYTRAVKSAENLDYPNRCRLIDLYNDILSDSHLLSVVEKRYRYVSGCDIIFERDGFIDQQLVEQLESPWFRSLVRDILSTKFYGFSLFQFYREGNWLSYDMIPRKHVNMMRREIVQRQDDSRGISIDNYTNMLLLGERFDLGLLLSCAPWVIYKRSSTGDWAQFLEVFGQPIREYIYDESDPESRERVMDDIQAEGAAAVFIHSKDSELNLREAKSGSNSSDSFERFIERANKEISKVIIGSTLTTEESHKGTQALGLVHLKSEDDVRNDDRKYVLDILNYYMTDIFKSLGFNTTGGKFRYKTEHTTSLSERLRVIKEIKSMGMPLSDDYIYESLNLVKPKTNK